MNLDGLPELLHSHIGLDLNILNPDYKPKAVVNVDGPVEPGEGPFRTSVANPNIHVVLDIWLESKNYNFSVFRGNTVVPYNYVAQAPGMQRVVRGMYDILQQVAYQMPLSNELNWREMVEPSNHAQKIRTANSKALSSITNMAKNQMEKAIANGRPIGRMSLLDAPISGKAHEYNIRAQWGDNRCNLEPDARSWLKETPKIAMPYRWFGSRFNGWKSVRHESNLEQLTSIRIMNDGVLKNTAFCSKGFAKEEQGYLIVNMSFLPEYDTAPNPRTKLERAREYHKFMLGDPSIYKLRKDAVQLQELLNDAVKERERNIRGFDAEEYIQIYVNPASHRPALCDICNPQRNTAWDKPNFNGVLDNVLKGMDL